MLEAIVLDFDGTIADSFEVFVESAEVTIGRKDHLSQEEIQKFRKYSTKQIIKELGVKKRQLPVLALRGKREVTKRMDRVEIFEGMSEVLRALSQTHKLYILSTNSQSNITQFLERYDLQDCIDKIYANTGIMGKAKNLNKLGKREHLKTSQYVYIGDETRDIEASYKVGVPCISVAWGYSDPEILATYQPYKLANTPQDIIAAIDDLDKHQ